MKLLISVRNREEAEFALAGGADLIDVKEPDRGPLGAADDRVIAEVVSSIAGRVPVSAALGELLASSPNGHLLPEALRYAKLGLSGCSNEPEWSNRWRENVGRWPNGASPVLVGYADALTAEAPSPEEVIAIAPRLGCGVVLLDTYNKEAGTLPSLLGWQRVEALTKAARQQGVQIALAGSLTAEDLPRLVQISPDWVAFRGAACRGDRQGALDREAVAELRERLERELAEGAGVSVSP